MKLEFKDRETGLPLPLAPSVGLDEKEMIILSLQNLPDNTITAINQLRLALLWILMKDGQE